MIRLILSLVGLSVASASGSVELTMDNFQDKLAGKNAFVKFLAPW